MSFEMKQPAKLAVVCTQDLMSQLFLMIRRESKILFCFFLIKTVGMRVGLVGERQIVSGYLQF